MRKIENGMRVAVEARKAWHNDNTVVDVTKFLIVCAAAGIVVCGGAFAADMSGQWYYC